MLAIIQKWLDRNLTPEEKERQKARKSFNHRMAHNPAHKNEEARCFVGDTRLIHFFRAVRENPVCGAVIFVNRRLDEGEGLEGVFIPNTTAKPYETIRATVLEGMGYHIRVCETDSPLCFDIEFGYMAAPLCGDGGSWHVVFDEQDNVLNVDNFGAYIS